MKAFPLSRRIHALPIVTACSLLLLLAAGCAGYRLGSTLPPGVNSVYVPVVVNDTAEPGLETPVTSAMIDEIQLDGSFKIASRETADSILEVQLKGYTLSPLRYRKDKTATAREYRLTLTADAVLRKRATSEEIYRMSKVTGFATIEALSDLPSARREALPVAARDLAHRIIRSATEYWP